MPILRCSVAETLCGEQSPVSCGVLRCLPSTARALIPLRWRPTTAGDFMLPVAAVSAFPELLNREMPCWLSPCVRRNSSSDKNLTMWRENASSSFCKCFCSQPSALVLPPKKGATCDPCARYLRGRGVTTCAFLLAQVVPENAPKIGGCQIAVFLIGNTN